MRQNKQTPVAIHPGKKKELRRLLTIHDTLNDINSSDERVTTKRARRERHDRVRDLALERGRESDEEDAQIRRDQAPFRPSHGNGLNRPDALLRLLGAAGHRPLAAAIDAGRLLVAVCLGDDIVSPFVLHNCLA